MILHKLYVNSYPQLNNVIRVLIPLLRSKLTDDLIESMAKYATGLAYKGSPVLAKGLVRYHMSHSVPPYVFVRPLLRRDPSKGHSCAKYRLQGGPRLLNKNILFSREIADALEAAAKPEDARDLIYMITVNLLHELMHYLNDFYGYGEKYEAHIMKEQKVDLGEAWEFVHFGKLHCIEGELDRLGVVFSE